MLILATTKDKYELPVAVTDSGLEMARLLHTSSGNITHILNGAKSHYSIRGLKIHRIFLSDKEEKEMHKEIILEIVENIENKDIPTRKKIDALKEFIKLDNTKGVTKDTLLSAIKWVVNRKFPAKVE